MSANAKLVLYIQPDALSDLLEAAGYTLEEPHREVVLSETGVVVGYVDWGD